MYFKQLCTCFKDIFSLCILTFGLITSSPAFASNPVDKASGEAWHYAEQGIMGTLITVKVQHTDSNIAKQAQRDVFGVMWDINNEMSHFKADSLLSKINQQAHIKPIKITDRLFGLIEKSLYYSKVSNGAFDITIGSIKKHFNFREKIRPSEETVKNNLKAINYNNIKLDKKNKTIFLTDKRAQLDLGGIAKGYAIAESIKVLKKYQIKNAYLSAGGDSFAIGTKDKRPWLIAIKNPRDGKNNIVLPVSDLAISTSGDYERYFIEDNVRYHHIINPATGKTLIHQ